MTQADEALACAASEPFALRVTDDSLAPEFPCGCVVVVDPSVRPEHGDWAVVRERDGPRLVRFDAARAGQAAIGVVVQRAGRRRREHRRYA